MSILACRLRSKALFAPVLPRPGRSPGFPPLAKSWARGHRQRRAELMTPEPVPTNPGESPRGLPKLGSLDRAVSRATKWLLSRQQDDGHWVFELEADATIPAEYILLQHYLGTIDVDLEQRIARYLRATQEAHGGWPLYRGGALDLSCSVKSYFALKAAGDPIDAPHMARARTAILAAGGARRSNVFTRILLALWGEVPWHAVPTMPVEMLLLPAWFPFHIDKISYWSRVVVVPLTVLMAKQPRAKNPRGVSIGELFVEPPDTVSDWIAPPTPSVAGKTFVTLDKVV